MFCTELGSPMKVSGSGNGSRWCRDPNPSGYKTISGLDAYVVGKAYLDGNENIIQGYFWRNSSDEADTETKRKYINDYNEAKTNADDEYNKNNISSIDIEIDNEKTEYHPGDSFVVYSDQELDSLTFEYRNLYI